MRDSTPEGIFLRNNPVISPVDMSNCIISRTTAIIDGVIQSLNSDSYQSEFNPDGTSLILDQVRCNLEELGKVVKLWHEAEKQQKGKVNEYLLSLHLETTGLLEGLDQDRKRGAA